MKTFIALLLSASSLFAQADYSTLLLLGNTAPVAPTPDLAWWKCVENTGTSVNDESTRGTNDLTLSSSSMWATTGGSVSINGNGSSFYAQSSQTVDYQTNVITIAFWLYDTAFTGTEIYFESGPDFNTSTRSPAIFSEPPFRFVHRNFLSSYHRETNSYPATSTWTHVLAVFDIGTPNVKIHINGGADTGTVTTAGSSSSDIYESRVMNLLARNGASLWSGAALRGIRIYTGDRSADVSAIYAAGD